MVTDVIERPQFSVMWWMVYPRFARTCCLHHPSRHRSVCNQLPDCPIPQRTISKYKCSQGRQSFVFHQNHVQNLTHFTEQYYV